VFDLVAIDIYMSEPKLLINQEVVIDYFTEHIITQVKCHAINNRFFATNQLHATMKTTSNLSIGNTFFTIFLVLIVTL